VSGFRASGGAVTARFSLQDAELLAGLARQLAMLVAERGDVSEDPVLARLLPDAYRDNAEDAAEFRRFTEAELGDEKVRNALALADALEPTPGRRNITLKLDAAQGFAWLRSLTDIRLALATRLGIDHDGLPTIDSEQREVTFVIYNWLGAVQDSLVRAVDR